MAEPVDFPVLQEIERAAGTGFRALGMAEIADDEPFSVPELAVYQRDGRLLVAVDGLDVPVAYLAWEPVDANAHVEQVSVHPDWARRGIGRELLEELDRRTADAGFPALTLTTFVDVPWNAPYYARLGFVELGGDELGPQLRAIRAAEARRGLDRWPRVAMRRAVTASSAGVAADAPA